MDQWWYCNLNLGLCTDPSSVHLRSSFQEMREKEEQNLTLAELPNAKKPRNRRTVYKSCGLASVSKSIFRGWQTFSTRACIEKDWKVSWGWKPLPDSPGSPPPRANVPLSSAALHGAVRLRQNFPEIPWLVLLVLELALCPHGFLCSHAQSLLSCPTLCDPMDCSPPGSSVRGIFQAGILEWVAISSSRGSSHPRGQTCVSCIADGFFTTKPLGEALRLPTDEATACALYIEGEIPADMQRTSFLGVKLPPVFPALDWLRSDPLEGGCRDGLFLSSWAAGSLFCSDAVNHAHFSSCFYLLFHSDFRPMLKLSNYQSLKRPVPAQILGPWAHSFMLLQERARQSILC